MPKRRRKKSIWNDSYEKTLKEISISLSDISNENLSNINLFNNQINKVCLFFKNNNFDINAFLNRFLNIKHLAIYHTPRFKNYDKYIYLENDENKFIEDIKITLIYNSNGSVISFSFSKIKNICLKFWIILSSMFFTI